MFYQAQLNTQNNQLSSELQEITEKMVRQFMSKCINEYVIKYFNMQAELSKPKTESIFVSFIIVEYHYKLTQEKRTQTVHSPKL